MKKRNQYINTQKSDYFFKFSLICAVLFLNIFQTLGQSNNIAYPFLKNYKHSDYLAGRQSWMISQAPNNIGLIPDGNRRWAKQHHLFC